MNRAEIMRILPHRSSMLLIDRTEIVGGRACGERLIRGDEFFLDGHFPGNPTVPGVILCEILAQSACVLLADRAAEGFTPMFTGLDRVRFKHPVRPGDRFTTECEITKSKGIFFWASGRGFVGEQCAVTAEFSFALVPPAQKGADTCASSADAKTPH